ncbi:MAG: AAA family ATPase [Candidatus Dormiibacterota bacterium]
MSIREPRLILICGLPGSGKSTLAKALAAELRAIRLCGDEWMAQLGIDLHAEDERERIEVLFWHVAQELLRLGHRVILESGFWLRSDRDEKRLGARERGVPVELRYIAVPFEELCQRVASRNQVGGWAVVPIKRELMERWATYFQAPGPEEIALFDPPREAPS